MPPLQEIKKSANQVDWSFDQKLEALQKNAFFRDISIKSVSNFAQAVHLVHLPEDQIIFDEGDSGHLFYLILEGTVILSRQSLKTGRQAMISVLNAGKFFGEPAILESRKRTTRASSKTPVLLAEMDKDDFLSVLKSEGIVATRNLVAETINRLKDANEQILTEGLEQQRKEVIKSMAGSLLEQNQDLLTSMSLITQKCERELAGHKLEHLAHDLRAKTEQVVAFEEELKEYVFPTLSLSLKDFGLREWWQEIEKDLMPLFKKKNISHQVYSEDLQLSTDRSLLSRLVKKLFVRILDISPSGCSLEWKIGRRDDWIDFQLNYIHPGITEYVALRLSDPFLAYGQGRNTWIDIALVKQWAEKLNGSFKVTNCSGEMVSLVISLPKSVA